MRTSTALLALALTVPAAASAQQASAQASAPLAALRDSILAPGMRVRMLVDGKPGLRIVGTIAERKQDTVVVDTVDVAAQQRLFFPAPLVVDEFRVVSLSVDEVKHVEVSMGRSRLLGVLTHGAVGALVSGTIVGLSAVNGRPNPTMRQFWHGFGPGAVVGAAIGIPFGYARGSEIWRPVFLPRPHLKPRRSETQ
jgi:hypothetical protein